MKRDTQRSKVYKAEKEAFRDHAKASERLETVEDMEKYVKYVFGLKRVRDAFPNAMPVGDSVFCGWRLPNVRDGRGRRCAGGDVRGITMPVWSRSKWIVLHELAHTISLRIHRGIAAHGWEYCATYLLLVRYALGVEAHDLLKEQFKAHRVRFRAPRKRVYRELTIEERTALVDRLAAMRAAKLTKEISA